MKKISAFILIFILILSSLEIFAADAVKSDGTEKKADIKTLVVLGDSISTGYGLDGYEAGTQNAEISSYANLAASRYGLVLGENYFNFASDGETSKEFLDNLNGGYDEEKLATIAKADTFVLTVGGNDILSFLVPEIAEMLGLEENASLLDIVPAISKIKGSELDDLTKATKSFCKDREDELSDLYAQYSQNLEDIAKKLKEVSPSAQIFALNIYDPLRDMPEYSSVTALDERIVSVIISEMNEALIEVSERNGVHVVDIASEFLGRRNACTNIETLDIHPNEQGHSIASDALCLKIDSVYEELNGGKDDLFNEPKHIWLWFAGALAVIAAVIPIVVFVTKKSSK